jgi:hypothetical protein
MTRFAITSARGRSGAKRARTAIAIDRRGGDFECEAKHARS